MSGPKFLVIVIWILGGAESNTWEIKMPPKIDVISGFCVQIPCQFEIPDSFKKFLTNSVEAMWKKTAIDGTNILNSDSELSLKGNVIGNILNKNCTTVFPNFPAQFSDIYFFRLQGPEQLRYTFNQGVNITVHKDVPLPILSPRVQVLEVLEGTKLTLTCSTVISCPLIQPLMKWSPQLGEQLTPALQVDEFGQTLLVSSQTFNATPLNDRLKVSCSILYYQGSKRPVETSVIIRVLYAPKNTIALLSPSGPVSDGSVVMLSCHSDANPAVWRYEWYKDSGSGKLVLQNQGQNLTVIARSNGQGLYVCKVYNNHGTDYSRAVTVDKNSEALGSPINFSCQCSIAPYIICGLLTLFLILITVVDLVKYKSLLKRLQGFEGMRGSMTYATLQRTSDSVYNVIQQTRGSRTDEDFDNRNLNKHQPKSEPWPRS